MELSSTFFFFQAEDGIRDLVRSRGLGDVYKRQPQGGQRVRQVDRLGAVLLAELLAIGRQHQRRVQILSLIHI